jgi:hypothetical protein
MKDFVEGILLLVDKGIINKDEAMKIIYYYIDLYYSVKIAPKT